MFRTKAFITSMAENSPILQASPSFPSGQFDLTQGRPEILDEHGFRRLLCWERNRAEHSGRCFLLMLVNVESVLKASQHEPMLSEIVSAVYGSTRQTDIAGWYREGAILGIMFTEIQKTDRSEFESLIRAKATGALREMLDAKQADQIHLSFHFFPEDFDQANLGRLFDMELYPDLFERDDARKVSYCVKRVMDIVGSIVALILCCPLFVVISLAIKLTSKGSILFKQERVGRYGLRFKLFKFRSMECVSDPSIHREYVSRFIAGKVDSTRVDHNQNVVYKLQDDARVTRLGKFLRKASLDELPQFINVLKGEMSLVGPRPPIPYELEVYQIWHRRRVLEAKPGITGLWQVKGRSRLTFDEMVRLDLQYAKTWSLWLDMKILLQTPRAVLLGEGAY
jgi:lipopolysaccharide/colanic/teichoic acid biosynthesis glycosyltransferase